MAPTVNEDFPSEDLNGMDWSINFDEIANLSMFPEFDNSKIMEDNNMVGVNLPIAKPRAVLVEPVAPDTMLFDSFNFQDTLPASQDLQPVSPEMFYLPASPQPTMLSDFDDFKPAPELLFQPASPMNLQPASSLTTLQPVSPASPGHMLQPASNDLLQPVSPGHLRPASPLTFLQPASPGGSSIVSSSSFSSEPEYLKPEPATIQYTVVAYPQPANVEPSVPILSSYTLQVKKADPVVEAVTDAPKKRGRKPKYPKGTAPPRRSRAKKTKVYEMGPLPDLTLEKKRKNAINAKLHRDKQKNEKENLASMLKVVTKERDGLLQLVEELKRSEASLRMRLAQGV